MRLEQVLPAYRAGKAIRREEWGPETRYAIGDRGAQIRLTRHDVNADDWVVLDDPITITREQFERAWAEASDYGGRPQRMEDLWAELQKPTAREE